MNRTEQRLPLDGAPNGLAISTTRLPDQPIEQPIKFDFVINLKNAARIRGQTPRQADFVSAEVIE